MLMINQLVGFGAFSGSLTETLVDRTTGTNIGNMTVTGGLAAAFDGTTNSAIAASCANCSGADGYIGKTYGAGKIYSKVIIYGSNDQGFVNNTNPSITLTLYGKNSVPASGTDGTNIGSLTFTDTSNESAGRTITSTDTSNSYTNVWVNYNTSGSTQTTACVELQIYELL